jgi:hypothetical protein
MATEEDNFDIDIYGDGEAGADGPPGHDDEADYYEEDEHTFTVDEPEPEPTPIKRSDSSQEASPNDANGSSKSATAKPMSIRSSSADDTATVQSQGVKRKGSPNERPVESGATTALLISDLHWWITEDDIRGWVSRAGAEDELKEVTFSEHKVNGKSKG